MQNIVIKTIPHKEQRYETVGDYFTDINGVRHFHISDMGNPDYEFLVALHELIESHLCRKRGITDASIDAFDQAFEVAREQGLHAADAEPGYEPDAPYRREHRFATHVERIVAFELGVNWPAYDAAVMALSQTEGA